MAKPSRAHLIAMLLCDRVEADDGGRKSLHGLFGRAVRLGAFPFTLRGDLYLQYEVRSPKHRVDIVATHGGTGVVVWRTDLMVESDGETEGVLSLAWLVAEASRYVLRAYIDRVLLGEITVSVDAFDARGHVFGDDAPPS